ncbi:MAG: Zn-ribbon domain-containing OB-fold protein [Planctomycetes bacterium]|nr:Zn-ribbon domain-containing OB-fold protein [Planctomycetota bacterium]
MSEQDPIVVRCTPELTYRYAAGRYGSRFLRGLKEGRILASRCRRCPRTLVPPRIACTGCFGRMEEVVEVPPRGELLAYTQVTFPFLDPFTGVKRPIPYCYGMVRFEGTDNTFQYFLAEKNPANLRVGQRVRAVFREERKGEMADLVCLEAAE